MEINNTEDYGFTEIEIAKVGDYVGSDSNGNPIEEHFTEESLKKIVEDVNNSGKEILVDKQHLSMKSGLDRDDSACGWLKNLIFRDGSIFAKSFWTKLGHDLISSRIMRFISPVFNLNDKNEPVDLINVALVNTPAITDIKPIINNAPNNKEISIKKETLNMEITKEELTDMIKGIVKESLNGCSVNNEEVKVEDKVEETTEKPVDETTEKVEDKVEEVKNEEVKEDKTEKVEETTEKPVDEITEDKVEDKEEKEVIKIETLNSSPLTIGTSIKSDPKWKKLTGKEFRDYIESGKYKEEM